MLEVDFQVCEVSLPHCFIVQKEKKSAPGIVTEQMGMNQQFCIVTVIPKQPSHAFTVFGNECIHFQHHTSKNLRVDQTSDFSNSPGMNDSIR